MGFSLADDHFHPLQQNWRTSSTQTRQSLGRMSPASYLDDCNSVTSAWGHPVSSSLFEWNSLRCDCNQALLGGNCLSQGILPNLDDWNSLRRDWNQALLGGTCLSQGNLLNSDDWNSLRRDWNRQLLGGNLSNPEDWNSLRSDWHQALLKGTCLSQGNLPNPDDWNSLRRDWNQALLGGTCLSQGNLPNSDDWNSLSLDWSQALLGGNDSNQEYFLKPDEWVSSTFCNKGRRAQEQKINKRNPLYKTELCRGIDEYGSCKYENRCQFAHSKEELRPKLVYHPNYRTQLCRSYHETSVCNFGKRCVFIHRPPEPHDFEYNQPVITVPRGTFHKNEWIRPVDLSETRGSGIPANRGSKTKGNRCGQRNNQKCRYTNSAREAELSSGNQNKKKSCPFIPLGVGTSADHIPMNERRTTFRGPVSVTQRCNERVGPILEGMDYNRTTSESLHRCKALQNGNTSSENTTIFPLCACGENSATHVAANARPIPFRGPVSVARDLNKMVEETVNRFWNLELGILFSRVPLSF